MFFFAHSPSWLSLHGLSEKLSCWQDLCGSEEVSFGFLEMHHTSSTAVLSLNLAAGHDSVLLPTWIKPNTGRF